MAFDCLIGDYSLEIHRRLRENELVAGKLSESTNEKTWKPLSK